MRALVGPHRVFAVWCESRSHRGCTHPRRLADDRSVLATFVNPLLALEGYDLGVLVTSERLLKREDVKALFMAHAQDRSLEAFVEAALGRSLTVERMWRHRRSPVDKGERHGREVSRL